MKELFAVLVFLFGWSSISSAEDIKIGEEYIEPLKYPKFSLGLDYIFKAKFINLKNSDEHDIAREIAGALSFEAGLYKYLNAGAIFSLNFPAKKDPMRMRLSLFAKPYIPFGERFSLFARVGGGLGAWALGVAIAATTNFLATAGVEFFPFSRLGITLESGYRGEIGFIRTSKNSDGTIDRPSSFLYSYDFPISLNVLVIL